MEIKTIKAFCEQSNIPAPLIRAVIRQCGGWESFKEDACDIARHGAGAGWRGFTYYSDTVAFTKRNKAAIVEMAEEQAKDFGTPVYEMIAGFNCLKLHYNDVVDAIYNPKAEERQNVFNALAWYALEEVARSYDQLISYGE